MTIPLLLLRVLFWRHWISDWKKIEKPIKYIDSIANVTSGLGLLVQLLETPAE